MYRITIYHAAARRRQDRGWHSNQIALAAGTLSFCERHARPGAVIVRIRDGAQRHYFDDRGRLTIMGPF